MNNINNLQQDPNSSSLSLKESDSAQATIWRWLRNNPTVTLGSLIVIVWIVLAILAPIIATHEPLAQAVADRLQPPNQTYFWGTDELGRDIFSRVLYGGRITIPAALAVVLIDSIL